MSTSIPTEPVKNNTNEWIEENKKFFLPPVCNKMMHQDGQMKSFYVGGPNQRKDYHIEEGEELFYMVKGDMCLKVVEKGVHKDIPIKEGEIFLLPGRIAHSPQRQADTVGLVIERERSEDEKDGLRYFVEDAEGMPTTESLFEEWFHCTDLGKQLGPVIKKFFASEQCKTGKPLPGTIPENPPIILNPDLELQMPFNLHNFIKENSSKLESGTPIKLFQRDYKHQFSVALYGPGNHKDQVDTAETFIWVLNGSVTVTTGGKTFDLNEGDNLLVRQGQEYTSEHKPGSVTLICFQDPTRKV